MMRAISKELLHAECVATRYPFDLELVKVKLIQDIDVENISVKLQHMQFLRSYLVHKAVLPSASLKLQTGCTMVHTATRGPSAL